MARLHEYQAKQLLQQYGIPIPQGRAISTADAAYDVAAEINAPVVVKAQIWTTSRAAQGFIRFADTPDEARQATQELLERSYKNFPVEQVLVEQQSAIAEEWYLGLIVDSRTRKPVLLLSRGGGSGIEDRDPANVFRHQIDILAGLQDFEARDLCLRAGISGKIMMQLSHVIQRFYAAARHYEARSAEINPLALTGDGVIIALDARFNIDDYAVGRHPELGIEIAREFDHPPTALERIAWQVEKDDYRGTFYFVQMRASFEQGDGVVGFHGAGGGGSMINMDTLLKQGFQVANFVDTSGNPPASKVYRAARIILSQANIDGYFAGGSGVASQEQFHSARGLVKAFMDVQLNVPAVIRIGGNSEEQAIAILERANGAFPAPVEAYGRDDSPDACAVRLRELVDAYVPAESPALPERPPVQEPYRFETVTGGTITYDHVLCRDCESKICIETCIPHILSLEGDVPVLNISAEEAHRGGCTECLACEVECYFLGKKGGVIHLPISGLDDKDADHVDFD